MFSIAVATASIAVCGSALAIRWTGNVEFSLAFALTILLAIVVVRRLEIDIWGLAAIAAFVLVISASIVWIQYGRLAADPITAYAEDTTLVEVTRRIWLRRLGSAAVQAAFVSWRIFIDYRPSQRAFRQPQRLRRKSRSN